MRIILFCQYYNWLQQMRGQQLRSRTTRNTRPAKKIMLGEEEHSTISSHLPKGYSLVRKSDLQAHLKREQVRKESKSDEKGQPLTSQAANQPIEQQKKEQLPSHANLDAQRTSTSTSFFKESAEEEQNIHKNDAPAKQSPKPKPGSKPKSTLDKASSALVNKAINQMINHTSFAPIYNAKLKTPEILEQINKIKRKARKSYMLDTFREDVSQLLQLYFKHHGRNQQAVTFERLVQTQILECSQQLLSIQKTSAREKEEQQQKPRDHQTYERRTRRNQEKKAQKSEEPSIKEDEESRQEPKKAKKKKEEKSRKPQETDDSVSQSESLINLPKRKGRPKFQQIPPRPKCSKILNSQVASLGYNFAKLRSEELYDIVTCLSGDKNQNMSEVSSEITVDLEQLTALQFLQLQAHVKNLLKSRNVEYEKLVDSDEDFVIEDDQ